MTPGRAKVFGIGFQRTGTSSLVRALNLLGINSVHNPAPLFEDLAHPLLLAFDGFADNPIPLLFRELDARFPGSKFILTDRDVDDWVKSVRWLFTVAPTLGDWGRSPLAISTHRALYGVTEFDEQIFRSRYLQHRADVLAYFERRTSDLLVVDFARGDGWEKLCGFLECGVPPIAFPHDNPKVGAYSPTAMAWRLRHLARRLRRWVRRG